MWSRLSNIVLLCVAAIVIALIFAMPLALAAPFMVLCLYLIWRRKYAELTMMLCSLAFVFACLEVAVRILSDDLFYREHEKWALKQHYRANVHDQLHARFGDLVAMDATLQDTLAEPHDVTFATDNLGFRNAHDYAGEPYVVLGDSFAASVGNSQENILVSQLNNALPNHFYSMGFPAAPKDYEANARRFIARVNNKARFVWFVFEGNDLFAPNQESGTMYTPSRWHDAKEAINMRAIPFMATRVLQLVAKNAKEQWKQRGKPASPSAVAVFDVSGVGVGFLKRYIEQAALPAVELRVIGAPEVMSRTACVFFIPEKYRVYKPWIKGGAAISEPAAGLAALHRYFDAQHIPVIDLTPSLQKTAASLMKKKQFVFWRDDTHWNPNGIAAIINDVKRCVESDKQHLSDVRQKNL